LVNLALLSAAHVHTKGFLQNLADHDDRNLVVIYDDVVDRGQRFAEENDAGYCDDLSTVLARDDVDGFTSAPRTRVTWPCCRPSFRWANRSSARNPSPPPPTKPSPPSS
jgi:hypothetical protein